MIRLIAYSQMPTVLDPDSPFAILYGMYNTKCAANSINKAWDKKVAVFQGTGGAFLGYLPEGGIRCKTRGNSGFKRLFGIPCNDLGEP